MKRDPNVRDRIDDLVGVNRVERPASRSAAAWGDLSQLEAIAEVKMAGMRPVDCSDEIPMVAPARGATYPFAHRQVFKTDAGNHRLVETTRPRARAMRVGDVFDQMQDQADRSRKSRKTAKGPLFTVGQIEAARLYLALVERLDAAGVKCSSVEARSGSGGNGSIVEAIHRDRKRIRAMHAAIGGDWALEPRRATAQGTRAAIRVRHVVDQVCLHGRTITEVLQRNGWSVHTSYRKAILDALSGALDRMRDC